MAKSRKARIVVPFGAAVLLLALSTAAWACTNYVGYMYVRGANTGTTTVTATGADNWNGPEPMIQTITGSVVSSNKGGAGSTLNWFKIKTAGIDTNLRYLRAGVYDVNVQNGTSSSTYGYTDHTTWNNPDGDCMTWTLDGSTKKAGQVTYLTGTDGVIDSAVDLGGSSITPDADGYYKFTLPVVMNQTTGGVYEQAVCISSLNSVNGNQAPLEILNVV